MKTKLPTQGLPLEPVVIDASQPQPGPTVPPTPGAPRQKLLPPADTHEALMRLHAQQIVMSSWLGRIGREQVMRNMPPELHVITLPDPTTGAAWTTDRATWQCKSISIFAPLNDCPVAFSLDGAVDPRYSAPGVTRGLALPNPNIYTFPMAVKDFMIAIDASTLTAGQFTTIYIWRWHTVQKPGSVAI